MFGLVSGHIINKIYTPPRIVCPTPSTINNAPNSQLAGQSTIKRETGGYRVSVLCRGSFGLVTRSSVYSVLRTRAWQSIRLQIVRSLVQTWLSPLSVIIETESFSLIFGYGGTSRREDNLSPDHSSSPLSSGTITYSD